MDHHQDRAGGAADLPMHAGGVGQAIDPVCGMTVDIARAESRGLHFRHDGVDYYFCGRGCRLDFEEDPGRYLDPSYTPSM